MKQQTDNNRIAGEHPPPQQQLQPCTLSEPWWDVGITSLSTPLEATSRNRGKAVYTSSTAASLMPGQSETSRDCRLVD